MPKYGEYAKYLERFIYNIPYLSPKYSEHMWTIIVSVKDAKRFRTSDFVCGTGTNTDMWTMLYMGPPTLHMGYTYQSSIRTGAVRVGALKKFRIEGSLLCTYRTTKQNAVMTSGNTFRDLSSRTLISAELPCCSKTRLWRLEHRFINGFGT